MVLELGKLLQATFWMGLIVLIWMLVGSDHSGKKR